MPRLSRIRNRSIKKSKKRILKKKKFQKRKSVKGRKLKFNSKNKLKGGMPMATRLAEEIKTNFFKNIFTGGGVDIKELQELEKKLFSGLTDLVNYNIKNFFLNREGVDKSFLKDVVKSGNKIIKGGLSIHINKKDKKDIVIKWYPWHVSECWRWGGECINFTFIYGQEKEYKTSRWKGLEMEGGGEVEFILGKQKFRELWNDGEGLLDRHPVAPAPPPSSHHPNNLSKPPTYSLYNPLTSTTTPDLVVEQMATPTTTPDFGSGTNGHNMPIM
jgi:hypothetical protein